MLTPLFPPTTPTCVRLGPRTAMHWLMVARLSTWGRLYLSGQRFELTGAPAYHDHNWGQFDWGDDISWEWGYAHADDDADDDDRDQLTAVWARVSDGRRERTLSQTLLFWRRSRLERIFQGHELDFRPTGACAASPGLTLPRIANLIAPGPAAGVPEALSVKAHGYGDELELVFRPRAVARIGVPGDRDPFRLMLLNEAVGDASLCGTTQGGPFSRSGSAVGEFMRG